MGARARSGSGRNTTGLKRSCAVPGAAARCRSAARAGGGGHPGEGVGDHGGVVPEQGRAGAPRARRGCARPPSTRSRPAVGEPGVQQPLVAARPLAQRPARRRPAGSTVLVTPARDSPSASATSPIVARSPGASAIRRSASKPVSESPCSRCSAESTRRVIRSCTCTIRSHVSAAGGGAGESAGVPGTPRASASSVGARPSHPSRNRAQALRTGCAPPIAARRRRRPARRRRRPAPPRPRRGARGRRRRRRSPAVSARGHLQLDAGDDRGVGADQVDRRGPGLGARRGCGPRPAPSRRRRRSPCRGRRRCRAAGSSTRSPGRKPDACRVTVSPALTCAARAPPPSPARARRRPGPASRGRRRRRRRGTASGPARRRSAGAAGGRRRRCSGSARRVGDRVAVLPGGPGEAVLLELVDEGHAGAVAARRTPAGRRSSRPRRRRRCAGRRSRRAAGSPRPRRTASGWWPAGRSRGRCRRRPRRRARRGGSWGRG